MDEDNVVLSEQEMAEYFEVSRHMLRTMRKEGLPYFKIGRFIRYRVGAVMQWLEQQPNTSNKEKAS